MTRDDIISRCTKILSDTNDDTKDIIREALDDAMQEFWYLHDWNFKIVNDATFSTDGSTEYTLATNLDTLIDVYDRSNTIALNCVEVNDIHEAAPSMSATGVPSKYAYTGENTIIFDKTASSGLTIYYTYLKKYTPCTDDSDDLEDDCGIPEKYHNVFIDGTLAYALPYMNAYDKAQYHLQLWDKKKYKAVENHEAHYNYMPQWKFDM